MAASCTCNPSVPGSDLVLVTLRDEHQPHDAEHHAHEHDQGVRPRQHVEQAEAEDERPEHHGDGDQDHAEADPRGDLAAEHLRLGGEVVRVRPLRQRHETEQAEPDATPDVDLHPAADGGEERMAWVGEESQEHDHRGDHHHETHEVCDQVVDVPGLGAAGIDEAEVQGETHEKLALRWEMCITTPALNQWLPSLAKSECRNMRTRCWDGILKNNRTDVISS